MRIRIADDVQKSAVWRIHRARHGWIGDWNKDTKCWISSKNNQIVATLREQTYLIGDFEKNETWLFNLWVRKSFRGQKLGQKLIATYLQKQNPSRVFIDCKRSLRKYYEELGFCDEIKLTEKQRKQIGIHDEPNQIVLMREI